ncbi:MAG: CPBP family intramembrane metalloprotease [Nitrospirae bacterium]|nr:CPBP family intramembrane metalloprotease [Nitrospirota bacterium]
MRASFEKKDIFIVILAVMALFVFLMFYEEASPTASMNSHVSRNHALRVARQYLEEQGFNLKDYDETVLFSENTDAGIYLQRTLGLDQFNTLGQELPLRYWKVRFLKELQYEEFKVFVNPQGRVIDFIHFIPEDAEGARLKQDQGLALAEAFIHNQKTIDLSNYSLINASTKERERRIDHIFTWKASTPYLGDAKLLMTIGVHGDVVDGYEQSIIVPEKFTEIYEGESSKGELLARLSGLFTVFLALSAIVVFLTHHKYKTIPWKGALFLALAMVTAKFLEEINAVPNIRSSYSTESPLYTFWGGWIFDTVESTVWSGVATFLFAVGGWAVGQEVFKGKRVDQITGRRGWLSRDFTHALFMGYLLASISLGYMTVFYLFGERYLGVWSPVPSSYSNMLGTWLPFLDPITSAFRSSVSEELIYRFFAIALLIKYLRSRTLALFIPALIWGFAHSDYTVFPFYTRGIELTVDGLVTGYFFIRYGLITVVVAHYVFDAVIMGMPLLQSSNLYFFWSGIAGVGVMAVPILLSLGRSMRKTTIHKTIDHKHRPEERSLVISSTESRK